MEPCKQEGEIGKMTSILEGLIKQIYGNGQEGLVATIPKLDTKISTLVDTVAELRVTVSGFAKFEAEISGIEKFKEKQGLSNRQKAGLYISGILGISSIAVALIIKFA
jgi:hypothetical protein